MTDTGTIEYKKISTGDQGIAETIAEIGELVNRYSVDFDMISLAREITRDVAPKDKKGEADALFWFVVQNVKFYNDPIEAELLQSPSVTLRSRAGDCDDFVILLATLNKAIGNDVAYVTVSLPDEQDFCHIFLQVFDRNTRLSYFYDPSLTGSHPGFIPDQIGRARLWYSSTEYRDLGGFFSKVWDEIKRFAKKVKEEIIEPIYNEIKRVERKVRKEKNRLVAKLNAEFERMENKLGKYGKFLVQGLRVNLVLMSPEALLMAPAGDRDSNPFAMNEDEWKLMANIVATAASAVLSVVSFGGAAPLLAASVISLAQLAYTAYEIHEQLEARKEVIEKLKQAEAKLNMERRVQREALAKLEKDIELLQELLTEQQQVQAEIDKLQLDYDDQVKGLQLDAEQQVLQYRTQQQSQIEVYRVGLQKQIDVDLVPQVKQAIDEIYAAKLRTFEKIVLIEGYSPNKEKILNREMVGIMAEFTQIIAQGVV